jgi:hypothetical protein
MSERCRRRIGSREDNRTCATHEGGTFEDGHSVNYRHCSKNRDPFVAALRTAEASFTRQFQELDAAVREFGWSLSGHTDEGWRAHGPAGRRQSVVITAPTPHGLLERIRQATNPLHRAPEQGSLL